ASPLAAERMGAVASAMPAARRRDDKSSTSPDRTRIKLQDDAPVILNTIATSKVAIAHSGNDADLQKYLNIIKSCESTENHVEVARVRVNDKIKDRLQLITLRNQWPLVFIKGDAIGGLEELKKLADTKILAEWLKDHKYDLIVVGGGSGGLAAAKMAAMHGKKVAVLDFVKPSPLGTTWGLGGTCVNVGCIPKKLMHQAALLGHSIKDAKMFGWKIPEGEINHSWENLKNGVQDHISSLNWGYRVQLREKQISATNKKGQVEVLTADRFLIATGLRPRYPPDVPGAREYCVSSDDLFSLPYPPGKTLCVGASYVSLECAGFLHGLGYDVTVMVRSILLRGFDQDMAERIRAHMKESGIKFENAVPTRIEEIEPKTKTKAGRIRVHFARKVSDTETEEHSEEYNTVVMAIGRDAMTKDIGLDVVGVETARNGKVKARREQSITCPYVYAIGDERVIGFHILAPNAGEITQGFGIALKLGGTKADFDRLIGIHPTVAECFTTLFQVKVPGGEELKASGC
ncbi:thioredoxin and glutathione reductase, partial [Ostertagia ostertagi]